MDNDETFLDLRNKELYNYSLNSIKRPISNGLNISIPQDFRSNSFFSSFDETPGESPKQNMLNTIIKLHSIVKQKSQLIQIQKDRIANLNKKLRDDQNSMETLKRSYNEHQNALSELKDENEYLQNKFNEMKNLNKQNENETQNLERKIGQIDSDTDQISKEVFEYEQKVLEFEQNNDLLESKIESALKSRKLILTDNNLIRNQIGKLQNIKEKYGELQTKVPKIIKNVSSLQKEVESYRAKISQNSLLIDDLTKKNILLKNQHQEETIKIKENKQLYSKLKIELRTKIELKNEIDALQNKLKNNQHFIQEVELNIQNENEYLAALKDFNKQQYDDNLSMKNYLSSLKAQMSQVKNSIMQLTMENANKKNMINSQMQEMVDLKLQKSQSKILKLHDKESELKNEIIEMNSTIKKIENDLSRIQLTTRKICEEHSKISSEVNTDFDFSDANLSKICKSMKRVENNNDFISSLIEDNVNLKEMAKKDLEDKCPKLPKQTSQERDKKYGLF